MYIIFIGLDLQIQIMLAILKFIRLAESVDRNNAIILILQLLLLNTSSS